MCWFLNISLSGLRRCYRMFKSDLLLTWTEADRRCELEGGTLIIIRHRTQQTLLHRWLIQKVIRHNVQNIYIGKIAQNLVDIA